MRSAVRAREDGKDATLHDLETMSALCPDVVVLVSIHKCACRRPHTRFCARFVPLPLGGRCMSRSFDAQRTIYVQMSETSPGVLTCKADPHMACWHCLTVLQCP